jgi:polar amino acid transport system substrate-binding protein
MKKKVFFILLICAVLQIQAQENTALQILTEDSPPANFISKGELSGSSVEMVNEMRKRMGLKEEIKVIPWARGYSMLESKPNIVLFSTTRTEEREDKFKWVGPLLRIDWNFYAKADSDIVINSLEDAKKVNKIGTYINDAREEYLVKNGFTNLESVTDQRLNVKKLMSNRIDIFVSSSIGIDEVLKDAGYKYSDVKELYVLKNVELYIAFSKTTDDKVVSQWQNAFDSMVKDGTYAKIYNKWYPTMTVPVK